MQINWNKRSLLHKKSFHLPQDLFGTPKRSPFHCFGTTIGLFSFMGGGSAHIFGQVVSVTVKKLSNTNSVASRYFEMNKTLWERALRRRGCGINCECGEIV